MDAKPELTPREITALFADPAWATRFPPILTVDEAAELARVPKHTIYAWSSQDLLKGCSRRVGKHLRILRDKFVLKLFNEGLYGD
jgi:excisionase family DNA binding protein